MTMTLLQVTTTSFELVIISYIISANLFALLFHIFINDVRMTTFTHQLLARKTSSTPEVWQCGCKYSSRSATVYVAVMRLRVGYAEIVFIQPGGKLDTMWRGAWQRLATRKMWPLQMVTHCSRTVLPLTRPETQKLAAWEPAVLWAKHFVHRIARIWTRLTCHLGCSSADGRLSLLSMFLLSWQNEESDCQEHGRNYHMVHSLPIHHFYNLFIYG